MYGDKQQKSEKVRDKSKKFLEERSINEFRETGLLLLTNQFLHIFGWALVVETDDDGNMIKFYPAYCKYRGFDSKSLDKAYEQITKHLKKRIPELLKDFEVRGI